MKNLLALFLLCLALSSPAQKIRGFYSGTLFNDSTKMLQKYELALNEYRGKIYGYSYVTFIKNDTFYYGIRKIKANIVGDSLIVEDDKMIVNNFPEPPAKGVGRTITIPLKGQDSLVNISGTWRTNQTRKYYSVPGVIQMARSEDSSNSPLIAHLKELNLIASENTQNTQSIAVEQKTEVKPAVALDQHTVEPTTVAKVEEPKAKSKKNKAKAEKESSNNQTENPEPKKEVVKNQVTEPKKEVVVPKKETVVTPAVLAYDQRKNKTLETVSVASDSLVLSFYDNGVIDGDSISVYLNGKNIISNTRLKATATKKTIYVGDLSEMTLLLVAENLGTLPPNTGLLMIKDGDNSYQVNFSADMQTNAMIVIRRKK